MIRNRIKVGVMGSAEAATSQHITDIAHATAVAIAERNLTLLTGATTGVIYSIGQAARQAGALHIGISPAANELEHIKLYQLPNDACDAIIYTGFGLKGRNVVLVRSCDIVLFIAGSIGSLNEFTIAYDEGKIIGCLMGTGGVSGEIQRIVETLRKPTKSNIFYDADPNRLIDACLNFAATHSIS